MQKHKLLLYVFFAVASWLSAQTGKPLSAHSFFKPIDMATVQLRGNYTRSYTPKKYETYQLDLAAMNAVLQSAPREFTPEAEQHRCLLAFPTAGGQMEEYSIWKIAMMDADLAARYPGIQTFAGQSLRDPGKAIRLTVSDTRGLNAMILRPDMGAEYVEPYRWGQTTYYMAFDHADYPHELAPKLARLNESTLPPAYEQTPYTPAATDRGTALEPVKLKIYRYAASTTGLFAQDHGGTKESALAAVTEYTSKISAIYERDLAIRLQLAPNNDKIIWTDPDTDPFTGTQVFEWMAQNAAVVGTIIGQNSFDLGHCYARYISGAAIGVAGGRACETSKARGCSAGNGTGDYGPFFVSVVGQETGHQMAGGHTWNRCDSTGGRSPGEAFEPGSGTTIMSYAGACGSDNVSGTTDLYFHSGSIEVIRDYALKTLPTCGSWLDLPNTAPTVTIPYKDGFFIPIRTAFQLNGSATDPDGDHLTYCWEEMDLGPEVPLSKPESSSPLFRTFTAVDSTYRYFPRLATVIANTHLNQITEQLPTYTRDLTFRLTVRDNKAGFAWEEVAFKAYEGAGPFKVLVPNTFGQQWQVGEYELVSWDVSNTDKAPINCSKVNIRLSVDGGNTYPYTLAANTENDGSQYVLVPNRLSSSCRIRVEGADNVFFDISDRSFRIAVPTQPTFSMAVSNENSVVCLPTTFQTTFSAAGTLGFSQAATLRLKDASVLPAGTSYRFDQTTLAPGGSASFFVEMPNSLGNQDFAFVILAEIPGYDTLERTITISTRRNDFSDLSLNYPAQGASGLGLTQTLRWTKSQDAQTYDVQLATSPAFAPADIIATRAAITLDSFKLPLLLQKATGYYWRVRPNNGCGAGAWTDVGFFSTLSQNCTTVSANDLPKTILQNGSGESKVNVPAGGTIESVAVSQLRFSHQFFKETDAVLISPQGTEVTLFKNKCGSQSGTFNLSFFDDALSALDCPTLLSGTTTKRYRPEGALSAFKGQNSTGAWTLRIRDNTAGSGGIVQEIKDLKLDFCGSVSLSAPFLVKNEGLVIDANAGKTIDNGLLKVEDQNNTASQLTFTLSNEPQNGRLERNGVVLHAGDKFTQADIDAGLLRYVDAGTGRAEDYFRFSVSDGEGGFFGTPKFVIRAVVGADEAQDLSAAFALYPNPAHDLVWIEFGTPVDNETRVSLLDATGRTISTAQMGAGSEKAAFPVATLPKGFYLVRVENATGVGVKRLTVQ